jgi:hypothetical protein
MSLWGRLMVFLFGAKLFDRFFGANGNNDKDDAAGKTNSCGDFFQDNNNHWNANDDDGWNYHDEDNDNKDLIGDNDSDNDSSCDSDSDGNDSDSDDDSGDDSDDSSDDDSSGDD